MEPECAIVGFSQHSTGAHGKYFWQQDKLYESSPWKIIENSITHAADGIKNLDYSEMSEIFQLKEKIDAAKDAEHVEKVLEGYFDEVWKTYDEKMHKDLPVLREKVYPLLKEFDDNLEELVKKSVKQLVSATSDISSGLAEELNKFLVRFEDTAENAKYGIRAEIDSLCTKVQTYVKDVKAEYEKYKECMTANWEGKAKDMKEEVEKELEVLKV